MSKMPKYCILLVNEYYAKDNRIAIIPVAKQTPEIQAGLNPDFIFESENDETAKVDANKFLKEHHFKGCD